MSYRRCTAGIGTAVLRRVATDAEEQEIVSTEERVAQAEEHYPRARSKRLRGGDTCCVGARSVLEQQLFDAIRGRLTRCKPGFSRRDIPLQRGELIEPFFIVGAGRSGTTLLRRMLVASRQVFIPPESYEMHNIVKAYSRHRHITWRELVSVSIGLYETHPEFKNWGISLWPIIEITDQIAPSDRSVAKIIDAIYQHYGQCKGATSARWGDKTPLYTFHLDWIFPVFPSSRFVHVLRDGCDVVHSMMSMGLGRDLAYFAQRWMRAVRRFRAFADLHTDACMEVRYEDLVTNTEMTARALFGFLGLEFSPSVIDELRHVHSSMGDLAHFHHHANVAAPVSAKSVGKGRKELDGDSKKRLQALIGTELELLGYEAIV